MPPEPEHQLYPMPTTMSAFGSKADISGRATVELQLESRRDPGVSEVHPYYESHRSEMEASMRMRLDLIDDLLQQHLSLTDTAPVKSDMMQEFEVVLTQMPYVGGAESRMSDFFMRLLGFMAIGRVLQRRGVPKDVIAELELESFKRHMLTVSEVERLEAGRKFMSDDSKALIREQAARSHEQKYQGDFVYDYVEPGPNDTFEFGVNYRACGFCKFASKHGDREILPHICGLDFAAYDLRGIHLERTQTLAQGAPYCNFRFSRKPALKSEG